ncbi:hypothetical protein [Streptomyces sp. NPDC051662]
MTEILRLAGPTKVIALDTAVTAAQLPLGHHVLAAAATVPA